VPEPTAVPPTAPPAAEAPVIAVPASDLVAGAITLSGQAAPNTELDIQVNGESVGTTTSGADGAWSLETELEAGEYDVIAVAPDEAGGASEPVSVTVGAGEAAFTLVPQDGVIPAGEVALSGTAPAGATVTVLVNGEAAGEAVADADGNWSLPITLRRGDYDIEAFVNDGGGSPVEGQSASAAFQIGEGAGPSAAITEPATDTPVAPGTVRLAGSADPGGEVAILVDGEQVGTATADANGNWEIGIELPAGSYSVVAVPILADGSLANALEYPVLDLVVEPVVVEPVFTSPTASDDVVAGALTVAGTAAPGAEITVLMDGTEVGRTRAGADGTFSIEIELPAGAHNLVAVAAQTDGAEATSETLSLTGRLARPVISSPTGGATVAAAPGSLQISGVASPNQALEILVDGDQVITTTANARGQWTVPIQIESGARTIVARYIDGSDATDSSAEVAVTAAVRRSGGVCRNRTPIPAEVRQYTVVENDTLYCISERAGLPLSVVRRDNPFITDQNLILPGQVLTLRERPAPTPAPQP
jgi:LysM repeat protein